MLVRIPISVCFSYWKQVFLIRPTITGFWRDDKLRQIATPLTGQIEVCVRLGFVDSDSKTQLQDALAALVENANDDTLLKSINLAVLMHTRSEDHRVRLFALTCAEALWRVNGGKMIGV